MNNSLDQHDVRPDVIQEMRDLAKRGTTVRELAAVVHARLGYADDVIVPVLWYFSKAFHLPLPDVLPIREWIGTDKDREIDALIMPSIERTRAAWTQVESSATHPQKA